MKEHKNKAIICVDMDDTIENLLETWISELNNRYNKSYSMKDITEWDVTKCLDLNKEQIYEVLHDDTIYDKILPYEDAQYYLEKLNSDDRFQVYIMTNTSYKIFSYKIENVLFKYFPFLKPNQVICIANKQLVACDVLVDDYDLNLIGGKYDKILINKPYNVNCITKDIKEGNYESSIIKRAYNWKDIYNYIINKTNKNLW